jgi:hypothetical protein
LPGELMQDVAQRFHSALGYRPPSELEQLYSQGPLS